MKGNLKWTFLCNKNFNKNDKNYEKEVLVMNLRVRIRVP